MEERQERNLKLISRKQAEQTVPMCDCSGHKYGKDEREDIIRYVLLGAEIQRDCDMASLGSPAYRICKFIQMLKKAIDGIQDNKGKEVNSMAQVKRLDPAAVAQVSKALNTLVGDFDRLIATGCIGNCDACPFGKVINKVINADDNCYEHGSCQITGEATVCDLLGILSSLYIS